MYEQAAATYGAALERLARAYEPDADRRRDLQELHLALWRSFAGFDGRCSLRTWVYRIDVPSRTRRWRHLRSLTGGAIALRLVPARSIQVVRIEPSKS